MSFWSLSDLELEAFRPGISSKAEIGENLVMACMEIGPDKEDSGHEHPFEQCGIVLEGQIEMFIGDDGRVLRAHDTYFIPAGVLHGWKTFETPAKILDISVKQA